MIQIIPIKVKPIKKKELKSHLKFWKTCHNSLRDWYWGIPNEQESIPI